MTKSNAERQAEFRARMKARGFREKLIWIDWEGHRGTARTPEQEQKPELTINQLAGQLKKITSGMNTYDSGRLFAELAAHARGLRGKWDLNELNIRKAALPLDKLLSNDSRNGKKKNKTAAGNGRNSSRG